MIEQHCSEGGSQHRYFDHHRRGCRRSIRRPTGEGAGASAVVAVRVKDRPWPAVVADLVEGAVAVHSLVSPEADRVRAALWADLEPLCCKRHRRPSRCVGRNVAAPVYRGGVARVVELADTGGLNPLARKSRAGSSPAPGTIERSFCGSKIDRTTDNSPYCAAVLYGDVGRSVARGRAQIRRSFRCS